MKLVEKKLSDKRIVPLIQTQFGGYYGPQQELNEGVSLTVPGQDLEVAVLIERSKRGLPLEGEKIPFYDEEGIGVPDFRTMDFTEIEELRDRLKDRMDEIRRSVVNTQNKRIQDLEKIAKDYEALKKEISDRENKEVPDAKPEA